MQGYIPVDIPTKPYIKAYVISKLGVRPLMSTDGDTISHKLYDLLQHETNERKDQFQNCIYTTKLRLYIPIRTFKRRGAFLNETNIKNLNIYIEKELKHRFYQLMNDCMELLPNIMSHLPEVRRKLGIDIEAWADDSMIKDYYRYRKRSGQYIRSKKSFALDVR